MKKQLLALSLLAAAVSLKAQRINPYPVIPLDSVQYVSPSKLAATPSNDIPDYINPTNKYPFADTVNIDGIVVMNPKVYGLATNTNVPSTSRVSTWLQKKGGGPWSGVQVMLDPTLVRPTAAKAVLLPELKFYDNCQQGFPVRMTVRHGAFQNETQMYMVRNSSFSDNSVEQLSLTPDTLVYTPITVDSLMKGNPTAGTWLQDKVNGEKWEGVLVEIRNVRVTGVSPFGGTRWNWAVQDDAGNLIEVRDMSGYFRNDDNEDLSPKIPNNFQPPVAGTGLSYIRGIITEYQVSGVNRYGIAPIMPSDVGPCNVCPPRVGTRERSPIIVTQNDSVSISANITADTVISTATLYYAPSTSTAFTAVGMSKIGSSDKYTAKIPPYASGTIVKYYIKVTDGRNITITVPDSLGSNSIYLVTNNGVNNIRDIQFAPNPANGTTIWNGDSLTGISVHGVVTATRMNSQTIIQDGQGVNSAVFIQNSPVTENWKIGDSVHITAARVAETFNVTTLYNVTATVLKSGAALPSFEMNLPLDSFRLNKVAYARPWEGVLMRWDSVFVAQTNADSATGGQFYEWSFNTNATANVGLRVDDLNPSVFQMSLGLTKGQHFDFVQGPMLFSFSNFKLIPRSLADVGMCGLDTLKPVFTGGGFDTVEVGSGAYTGAVTALDNRDGNLTGYMTVTGSVNTATIGDYTLTYYVTDFCGNMDSTTLMVHVKDTPQVGLNMNELSAADINVFPSPATDVITISAKGIKTLPLNVAVYDVIGRQVIGRTYNETNVSETISISTLNNGVYFCVIKNAQGSRTVKFVVNGK